MYCPAEGEQSCGLLAAGMPSRMCPHSTQIWPRGREPVAPTNIITVMVLCYTEARATSPALWSPPTHTPQWASAHCSEQIWRISLQMQSGPVVSHPSLLVSQVANQQLTARLLPHLCAPGEEARVVTVASSAHSFVDGIALGDQAWETRSWDSTVRPSAARRQK